MQRLGAIAAVAVMLARPAAAETWWMGAANPAGVTLIDFDSIATDENGRRTAAERLLTPRDTVISGKPVAVVIAHQAYDCEAGTVRFVGGNATTAEAKVVVRIPAGAEAKPLDPKTDGGRVMKLVCATSDAERARYGRFVGEADFDGLVARWRPPARKR